MHETSNVLTLISLKDQIAVDVHCFLIEFCRVALLSWAAQTAQRKN